MLVPFTSFLSVMMVENVKNLLDKALMLIVESHQSRKTLDHSKPYPKCKGHGISGGERRKGTEDARVICVCACVCGVVASWGN